MTKNRTGQDIESRVFFEGWIGQDWTETSLPLVREPSGALRPLIAASNCVRASSTVSSGEPFAIGSRSAYLERLLLERNGDDPINRALFIRAQLKGWSPAGDPSSTPENSLTL